MTAQDSRAMFEARMKQSPAYKPELMKWTDGRYDFNIMESAYHGFILGMESAQPPEAAPVQMPDPAASAYMSEPKDDGAVCTEMMINPVLCKTGWNKLYTEHQVLEIIKGLR